MGILSDGTILTTDHGYINIEDFNPDYRVLTENGFKDVIITKINNYEPEKCVRLTLWSFKDPVVFPSYGIAHGVRYLRCLDLGSVGPCICRPYNRCWKQCPDDHPNKLHIQNPCNNNVCELLKNSYLVAPITGTAVYGKKEYTISKPQYDRGFKYGRRYKDLLDIMPSLDVTYEMTLQPDEFMSFIKGWQDSMVGVTLDMWNYRFVLKNKKLATQIQFLLNYFGTPCALSDYKSNVFGDNCYLLDFCKYKKPFFFKTWDYNNYRYITVKRNSFLKSEDIINKEWYSIQVVDNAADYICCPFLYKV